MDKNRNKKMEVQAGARCLAKHLTWVLSLQPQHPRPPTTPRHMCYYCLPFAAKETELQGS